MRAVERYRGLLLALCVLALWGAAGFVFYKIDYDHDAKNFSLIADLIEHKRDLAAATGRGGGRIVVAGGSNAYYGLDSDVIAARTGRPVVNLALPFGGYDKRINVALIERVVRPGDLVVFSAATFWSGDQGGTSSERRELEFDAYLAEERALPYQRQFESAPFPWQARPRTNTLLLSLVDRLRPAPKAMSWIRDTNMHGDFTGCKPRPVLQPAIYSERISDGAFSAWLTGTARRLEARGARLVLAVPWMFIRGHDRADWENYLRAFVLENEEIVPVISAPPSVVLREDQEDFCDSPYHLSREMSAERSRFLARRLDGLEEDARAEVRRQGP